MSSSPPCSSRSWGRTGARCSTYRPATKRPTSSRAFEHRTVELDPGSIFAAVTDGFSEARNASSEFLGPEALVEVILRNRAREAERQAEAITLHAYEYSNQLLRDDVAALVVKVAS